MIRSAVRFGKLKTRLTAEEGILKFCLAMPRAASSEVPWNNHISLTRESMVAFAL